MSYYVYRYIDTATSTVKYVGITNGKRTIKKRVIEHKREDWYKNCNWIIEYFEVKNQSEAEAFESHLIALYKTYKWYNTMKVGWGINSFLPMQIDKWIKYDPDSWKPKQHDDLTGQRFGRLVCVRRSDNHISPSGIQSVMWECKCDCGNTTYVLAKSLKCGRTMSCGCLNSERASDANITHGFTKDKTSDEWKLYSRWNRMNKVGRCAEWSDPEVFFEWAITHKDYSLSRYLERIDKTAVYSPDNCRWVDKVSGTGIKKGSKGTHAKLLSYNGETHNMREWEHILGLSNGTLRYRLKNGWSLERALSTVNTKAA